MLPPTGPAKPEASQGESSSVFIFLDRELDEVLVENGVDLVEALRDQGLAVERGSEADPAAAEGTKEAALVILATGVTFALLGQAIARVVEALNQKPVVVTKRECTPVLDASGRPVPGGRGGKPLMQWRETPTVVIPQHQATEHRTEAMVMGLRISVSDKPHTS